MLKNLSEGAATFLKTFLTAFINPIHSFYLAIDLCEVSWSQVGFGTDEGTELSPELGHKLWPPLGHYLWETQLTIRSSRVFVFLWEGCLGRAMNFGKENLLTMVRMVVQPSMMEDRWQNPCLTRDALSLEGVGGIRPVVHLRTSVEHTQQATIKTATYTLAPGHQNRLKTLNKIRVVRRGLWSVPTEFKQNSGGNKETVRK